MGREEIHVPLTLSFEYISLKYVLAKVFVFIYDQEVVEAVRRSDSAPDYLAVVDFGQPKGNHLLFTWHSVHTFLSCFVPMMILGMSLHGFHKYDKSDIMLHSVN